MQRKQALWTFLEIPGIKPTNNAAEWALRPSVIHRKISHGVQSRAGGLCRSRLLADTATLRQQGRDVWSFLEQAWIAHRLGSDHKCTVRIAPRGRVLRSSLSLLDRLGI